MKGGIGFYNIWNFVCRDKDGKEKWRERVKNLVTYEGLNNLLSVYLAAGSQYTTWNAGLISNNYGTPSISQGDTAGGITTDASGSNNWGEDETYTAGQRISIMWGSASSQSIDNSGSPCVFTMNGSTTIYGAFVDSNALWGSTGDILFKEAAFGSAQSVNSGDTITLTITISDSSL